jgi:glycosyltransferase involved in cell wall biosynthesis
MCFVSGNLCSLLFVQIPCLNEEGSLGTMLRNLNNLEITDYSLHLLIVDDGSTDRTLEVARNAGVDLIVSHKRNRGLAAAFDSGLAACLRAGADIIVNTDADGQYPASEIPRLLEPILSGRADLVIGDRRPSEDMRLPWLKRKLQKLGSKVVSWLAGQEIPDAVSGFRAMTREAAIKTHIVTGFSYTIESILQAASKGLKIEFVPINTNPVSRPSRLFRSKTQFVLRSAMTMLRVFFMFRPLAVLLWISGILAVIGGVPIVRFLILWMIDGGKGHIQSLVLGGVFIVLSAMTAVAGFLADLMATNRRLLEMTLEKVKMMECEKGKE